MIDAKKQQRWLRYRANIPSFLKNVNTRQKWASLMRLTATYYSDIYLDALVALDYFQRGFTGWAAISGGIFLLFMSIQLWRSYQFSTRYDVHLYRTTVMMLTWNSFFASDPPQVTRALTTEQLQARNEEGLFEAPIQVPRAPCSPMNVYK